MTDFVQLVNGLGDKDPKTYFEGFFTRSVFNDYQIDESAEKDARQAIKTMFTLSFFSIAGGNFTFSSSSC